MSVKRPSASPNLKDRPVNPSTASDNPVGRINGCGLALSVLIASSTLCMITDTLATNTPPSVQSNRSHTNTSGADTSAAGAMHNTGGEELSSIDSIYQWSNRINPDTGLQALSATQLVADNNQDNADPSLSRPWVTVTVKPGDTLSEIFRRHDLPIREAYAIADMEKAKPLLIIRPGEKIQLQRTDDNKLLALRYKTGKYATLEIDRIAGRLHANVDIRTPEVRYSSTKAIIETSLLDAAEKAQISIDTIEKFIVLFGWRVDFAKDIHPGDQFSVIYEELYLDDRKIEDGQIIAAELITRGEPLRAIRYKDDDNVVNYYTPEGESVESSFLRTPLKWGRITSKFNPKRLHPVAKTWRAHRGVDYGAPPGTPVLVTGDGTVTYAGRKGGYGKVVIVKHGEIYSTLYAHLRQFAKGIRRGERVKQGEIIGYVGSTGMATGPHLHYEFRIHGVHKNPLTVELPKSASVAERDKKEFLNIAQFWSELLDDMNHQALTQNQTEQ